MIPVTQTKVVVRNSKGEMVVRGNCWPACIASILELPIEAVPNTEVFMEFHEKDGEPQHWFDIMQVWLRLRGLKYETGQTQYAVFHSVETQEIHRDHMDHLREFFNLDDIRAELKDAYYLVSGPSPRGVNHCVIYQNGIMVHDPHPSREGILKEEYFEHIVKIQP